MVIRLWYTKKMKKCLRNTNILNCLPRFDNSSICVVTYQSFTIFRSDGLFQDKYCKEIINQEDKEKSNKTFFLNDWKTKFHIYSLKVSASSKIAMQCI